MSKTSKTIRKMCALAGITVLAATAGAVVPVDARIMIDRALNSPTLTVRYDGASVALVELRVNGESLGTRSVSSAKSAGETNFTLNLAELKDGDNDVEIRLFDRTGKLVGSDKSNISTDQTNYGPVFLKTPKVGATVRGSVEIDMGFGRDLKNVYVSFFVDSNFKRMTNYPPYNMVWDTTGESNGWHEIEAWAIDETSTTYKTRKTRIFVDNPSGRTERQGVNTELTPSKNPMRTAVEGSQPGLRNIDVRSAGKATAAQGTHLVPKQGGITVANQVRGSATSGMAGMKPAPIGMGEATSVRTMAPTFNRVAHVSTGAAATIKSTAKASQGVIEIVPHNLVAMNQGQTLRHVSAATGLLPITKGQRLPNLATFEVVLNSSMLAFPDVQPRVDDGVPMTPFRYLMEKAGGNVDWENMTKTVSAKSDGHDIVFQIGDKTAKINKLAVTLEVAPYIDRGRTIVPLSFIHDALNVNVEYDKETGHVLISTAGK